MSFKRLPFAAPTSEKIVEYGTPKSGNWLHAGRPGHVGGSSSASSIGGSPGDKEAPRIVFSLGGGGSGKSTLPDRWKAYGVKNFISSDDIKHSMPLYSYRPGQKPGASKSMPNPARTTTMYGPSGPRNEADYMQYSPKERAAMESYIQENTPFSGSKEFGQYMAIAHPEYTTNGDTYGGGLTHEISSYMSKQQLNTAIENKQSAFYDSTGASILEHADAALAQGMHVSIHSMNTETVVAQYRNGELRDRTVDHKAIYATHLRVAQAKPAILAWVSANAHRGASFHEVKGNTEADVVQAVAAGYNAMGKTK